MEFFLIPLITFFALFMKGITGTGTSTVLIAFSSLLIDPKLSVVLASCINIYGGLLMLRLDPVRLSTGFWLPIALAMGAGAVAGAMTLKCVEPGVFELILGVIFLTVAFRFLFMANQDLSKQEGAPESAAAKDLSISSFAGFCGGFVGINAPVLITHFGRYLNKQYLRRLLVLIFIPSAFAQTGTFYLNGMLNAQLVLYAILSMPTAALGIYIGNKFHHRISETWFKRLLGGFLLVVSMKLIF